MKSFRKILSSWDILSVFTAFVLCFSLSSCRVVKEVQIETDTIVKTEIKEIVVHDTTKVTEVKHDSVDRYVVKTTYVDSNGVVHEMVIEKLTHYIFEQNSQYEAKIAVYKDSIADLEKKMSEMKSVEYVAKPLTWWQKTQIYGFWTLLAVIVVYIIFLTRKKWINFLKDIYI